MNRSRTALALTGAIGLLAVLPSSQAIASHVPGATYTGTHEQGGSVTFTLTGDLCAAAKKKVKKLKKQLKNADSASAKKKIRKKLRNAKRQKKSECVSFTGEPGVPTGERVQSFTVGGPVTGSERVGGGPCLALGPGSHPVTWEFGFRPYVRETGGGLHSFALGELAQLGDIEIDGIGLWIPQRAESNGRFDLAAPLPSVGTLGNECQARVDWTAQKAS